jgi:hypothetical protein
LFPPPLPLPPFLPEDLIDLYKQSDAGATTTLLGKMSVERSYNSKLDDVRSGGGRGGREAFVGSSIAGSRSGLADIKLRGLGAGLGGPKTGGEHKASEGGVVRGVLLMAWRLRERLHDASACC